MSSHALRHAAACCDSVSALTRRVPTAATAAAAPPLSSLSPPSTTRASPQRRRRRHRLVSAASPIASRHAGALPPRRFDVASRAAIKSLEGESSVTTTTSSSSDSSSADSDGVSSTSTSSSSSSLSLSSPSKQRSSSSGLLFRRQRSTSSSSSSSSKANNNNDDNNDNIPVDVEPAPSNSRRLYASVDIAAPSFVVWSALTNYERLGDFIPGLAENRCLARTASGATLLQVGEQSVALGLRFRARVVLDIQEHEQGLPATLWGGGGGVGSGSGGNDPFSDGGIDSDDAAWARSAAAGLFPQPRSGIAPSPGRVRDISFALIEGDFAAFRGVWRIQDDRGGGGGGGGGGAGGENAASSSSSTESSAAPVAAVAAASGPKTRLSYALYVRPQPWLPVHLVQARIRAEVATNLDAVRRHTERVWRGE